MTVSSKDRAVLFRLACLLTPLGFQCNNSFQQTLKAANMVKEQGLESEAVDRLVAALREVPFLASARIRRENARGDSRIDFILTVRSPTVDRRLVCEVKSGGQP